MENNSNSDERRVLVYVPTSADARICGSILSEAKISSYVSLDIQDLVAQLHRGAAAILLTEEIITSEDGPPLFDAVQAQPSWSDIPMLMLCSGSANLHGQSWAMEQLGNVTILERPVRINTMVSAVRSAIRSRDRQYEVRDQVLEIGHAKERFRDLADNMSQSAWEADKLGSALWYNKRWLDYTGLTMAEARGRGWEALVHPEHFERLNHTMAESVTSGSVWEETFPLRGKEGTYRWFLARAVPVRDGRGNVVRWFGTNTDITDLVRTREALAALTEESERRRRLYETILSNTPDFIYVFDLNHRFSYLNASLLEMWGKSYEESIDKTFTELGYEPWHADKHDREIAQVIATKQSIRSEVPFTGTKGRRIYDYIFMPILNEQGEVEAVGGTTRDVTDRKEWESALLERSQQLRMLWEAAEVMLTTSDPDAMMHALFAKIAPRFQLDVYFNFMVDEPGKTLRLKSCEGVSPETAESIQLLDFGQAVCGRVAQSGQPITATHIQDSDDPMVALVKSLGIRTYACTPLIAGDQLLGTLSFASRQRDEFHPEEIDFLRTICHYVTAAYERIQLVDELRQADRRKDEFLATLAHELRNPLAPIRAGIGVLQLSMDDPATMDETLRIMDRQLTQLVRLIDDLLDVSRITRGKIQLRREICDLNLPIRSAVESSRPFIEEAGVKLTLDLPAENLQVDADPVRLAQVFSNLLNNAAKFTGREGEVRLYVERQKDDVLIQIEDTGIGIPHEMLGQVFEMFTQVDDATGRNYGGLGIGLSLVKGLVELHGGEVTAESEGLAQGSRFTVRLPVHLEEASRQESHPAPAVKQNGSYRVLVVDDNQDAALVLSLALRMAGSEVRTAFDGLQALSMAEEFRPELIFLDLGMPVLDGFDTARRIRSEAWGSEVMLVALTGWGQEDDKQRVRDAGFDRHLVKPAETAAIKQVIAELEGRRGKQPGASPA